MHTWVVAAGLVLFLAAGIGLVTAVTTAPACVAHGPARLVGRDASPVRACAVAEEQTASALVLAVVGTAVATVGAAMPSGDTAPSTPATRACPACGRRIAPAHGFCPACGAEPSEAPTRPPAR